MLDFITINEHSSIRVDEGKIIYSDPYNINCAPHDADIILITHSHFDHYSPDDIRKVLKSDTIIVCPDTVNEPKELGLTVKQGPRYQIRGCPCIQYRQALPPQVQRLAGIHHRQSQPRTHLHCRRYGHHSRQQTSEVRHCAHSCRRNLHYRCFTGC